MSPVERPRDVSLLALLLVGASVSASALGDAFADGETLHADYGGLFAAAVVALSLSLGCTIVALVRSLAAFVRARGPLALTLSRVRLLIHVFWLGAVGYLVFLQPFRPIFFGFFVSLVFGGFAALVLLERPLESLVPARWRRRLHVGLTNLLLLAILAELVLRGLALVHPRPILVRRNTSPAELIETYRFPPGTVRAGFPCNGGGHYDEEFAPRVPGGDRVVVCIGDSFSVGSVPHSFHFTTVCERALPGVQLYNMGVSAIDPPEYRHLLEHEALPLRPDAVVIGLFVGNDVEGCRRRRRQEGGIAAAWLDRQNLLLYLVPKRAGAAFREMRRTVEAPLPLLRTEREILEVMPSLADPLLETPVYTPEGFLEIEAMRARAVCSPDRKFYPDLFAVLDRILETAGGTPLFVLLIPDEFQVEDTVWDAVRSRLGNRPLDRDQPQRIIGEWLAAKYVPALDLLPLLRDAEPWTDGKKRVYALRDTHFNARGNRIAGEALAAFLEERLD